MVLSADRDSSRYELLLKVALEAETLVAGDQHSLVDRAVRLVTRRAAFTQRLVLIDKRPELHRVTLAAGLVFRKQRSPSGLHHWTLVRVVAAPATDLAFEHRVMVRQTELPALVQMALKAGFRRFARVDDGVARPARLIVNAAGTVAGLATRVLGVVSRRLQPHVRGGFEIARNRFVALRTGLRTDELGAGDVRRRHDSAVDRGAGDSHCRCRHNGGNRHQSPAAAVSLPGIAVPRGRVVLWIFHRGSVGFRKVTEVVRDFCFGRAKQAVERHAQHLFSVSERLLRCQRHRPMPVHPGWNTVVSPTSARVHELANNCLFRAVLNVKPGFSRTNVAVALARDLGLRQTAAYPARASWIVL